MKKIEVIVKKNQDPFTIALNYLNCPECGAKMDKEWSCKKCKLYIVFVPPEVKKYEM
jgi:hypothetical protein